MSKQFTRNQALERLVTLEAETAQIRKLLDENYKRMAVLPFPDKSEDSFAYCITSTENGSFDVLSSNSKAVINAQHGNLFTSKDDAMAYVSAINMFLLLRKQEGTKETTDKTAQWLIECDIDKNIVAPVRRYVLSSKMSRLSPAFATEESASKAIKALGKENLIAMFKTFHAIP